MLSLEQHIMDCSRTQAAIFCSLRQVILSLSPEVKEEIQANGAKYKYHGIEYSVKNVPSGTVLYVKNKKGTFSQAAEKTYHFTSHREIDAGTLISSLTSAVTSRREHADYR
ncbi:MAG TPA: hypothetical protein VEC12_14575 [Bacteroidia bacterium]|nr:hypothetical protein [Bacteroidia bacterium]